MFNLYLYILFGTWIMVLAIAYSRRELEILGLSGWKVYALVGLLWPVSVLLTVLATAEVLIQRFRSK